MGSFDNINYNRDSDLIPFVFSKRQLHILNHAMFLYLKNYESFKDIEICGSEMLGYIKNLQIAMNLRYDFNWVLNSNNGDLYLKPFKVD